MNKILTISIAAYNVESYIKDTLESLIASKYINELEIFVVDDGGSDNTLSITQEYAKRFPNSIYPIHKENGGYGSTVNYSIKHATGKYFKLLDGDDWFNTDELDKLVEKMKIISSDVVVMPYWQGTDKNSLAITEYKNTFQVGAEMNISDLRSLCTLGMWALSYKTETLRSSQLELPEHLFYTDQIFCTIPFAFAKTIQYFDYGVYCYRLGREGQSISRESRVKNIQMTLDICSMLARFVSEQKENKNYEYLLHRVTAYYFAALKTILLLDINAETLLKLKNYECEINNVSSDIYNNVISFGKLGKFIKICRFTNYYGIYLLKFIYPKGIPNWA